MTAPDETAKSEFENDATPLEPTVASVPAKVISSLETVVATPFEPENVSVPPVVNVSLEPASDETSVNELEIEPNDRVPEPFVLRNSPLLPSAFGNVNVTLAPNVFGAFSAT